MEKYKDQPTEHLEQPDEMPKVEQEGELPSPLRRLGEGALYLASAVTMVAGAAYAMRQSSLEINKRQAKQKKNEIMRQARPGGKLTAEQVGEELRKIDEETTDEPDGHEFPDTLRGKGKGK